MSALLTKAFEKWVAECTANNQPARPDAIVFALMEREPSRDDGAIQPEKITHTVSELSYGQLDPNSIVCSAVVADEAEFSYDWICLIHQASNTLCGIINTPVRQKLAGESLIRNFTIIYSGMAQAAHITVPPQSWQVDISPELKKTLKTENHLSEIAVEGEEAQQESRNNLGLKSAATMEPQRDIYDRTAGCLALPGAFGYGHLFSSSERVYFSAKNGPTEFLQWVRETPPGRYLVAQYGGSNKKPIIDGPGTPNFSGYLDIDIHTDAKQEDQQTKTKQVTFKGINGEIYTARIYGGTYPSDLPKRWEKWLLNADDFTRVLYSAANTYRDPDVGGLVLAAYTGASDDEKRIVINRRHMCEGSRLRQVVFEAEYRSSGFESAARALVGGRSLPGTYISLSGTSDAPVFSYGVITLFIRIA